MVSLGFCCSISSIGTFLALLGIIASFALLKYREHVGDMLGEAEWMKKVGGVYNVVIIAALLLFFWCLAELTGTTTVLFGGVRRLIPGAMQTETPSL